LAVVTLALVLLALGWPLAAWLYWSRRQERREHAIHAAGWFRAAIQREHEIAEMVSREMVNRERRNSGKAEM
jgi:4-amino-4-deoxy-L-arabinose transferase-like glycosyltransferase